MSVLNSTTSTTRPSNPSDGELFFETDTRKLLLWDGSAWREYDNTSGATSGGGTGGTGSGTGDSGSGTGDSGSGTGGSGGGTGGTTPGAGTNTDTGITYAVAQPGSGHDDSTALGNDTSTGDIYSINTHVNSGGAIGFMRSSSLIETTNNGRISYNNFQNFGNIITSMWVRFDEGFENLKSGTSSNRAYYLWKTAQDDGTSATNRGIDFSYCYLVAYGDSASGGNRMGLVFYNQGLINSVNSFINLDTTSTGPLKAPYNPYIAHNAPGGEAMTGHHQPETMEWQLLERPFHPGRWYHIAFNWHRENPGDWTDPSKDQYLDLWLDGVKQSTLIVKTNGGQVTQANASNAPRVDNFMIGGSHSDESGYYPYGVANRDEKFPGIIQRFTQYQYRDGRGGNNRLFDDEMKALYALGAEATNPLFASNLPDGDSLKAFDIRMGDDNTFPGAGNSIPVKWWERIGDDQITGDNEYREGVVRSSIVPSWSSESFKYVNATYERPYTFGIGTWKSDEYSDGILNTGYKTDLSNGGSVMMWVNLNDVDRAGIQYLFGARNSPDAVDRDGNNPDQFAIGVEQALGSTACRFKLYFMQEDATSKVFAHHNHEWHCIAMMVDTANDKVNFCHNGSTNTGIFTGISSRYSGSQLPPFYIGDANGGNNAMDGLIGRVHYYDGVWSLAEMQALYKEGPGTRVLPNSKSTLDYMLDGRLTNIGGSSSLYPRLTYTGTGLPKYARSRPY